MTRRTALPDIDVAVPSTVLRFGLPKLKLRLYIAIVTCA
jgi:hypothetical protein